ncbi:MAG: YgiT-type zinc finger protein [Rectinemataceae bacterium]|nr:YgiT-type zinc finger protein [Rectinemataceae bacterium]
MESVMFAAAAPAKPEYMSDVFNVDGRRVLVEHIPALVCERCGEATLSREKPQNASASLFTATPAP